MSEDPLDKLIIDENKNLDIALLASLVGGFLKFTREGEIVFEREFYKLRDWQKNLIYLLGRKIIFIKKLKQNFKEEIAPREISKILGIPATSITRCAIRELKGIIKSENGLYKIPNYTLYKCEEIFKNIKKK